MSLGLENEILSHEDKVSKLKAKYERGDLTKLEYLQAKENLTDELMMSTDKDYLKEKDWNNLIKKQKENKQWII